MALHTGYAKDKVDLSDIEKRLKTLEKKVTTNGNLIQNNKNEISANYTFSQSINTKVTANGTKIATKTSHTENFEFIFENSKVGSWSQPMPHRPGNPTGYVPLLNVSSTTQIHLQFQIFDDDTTLNSTEKAQYFVTFLKSDGHIETWQSPTTTPGKILNGVYTVDVKLDVSTVSNYKEFKCFKVAYKPYAPSKISGNESRLFVTTRTS